MTTLKGNELLEYLAYLDAAVNVEEYEEGSLRYLMSRQMQGLFENEKSFLELINSNGTEAMLSIRGNGLPSVESLRPDLEKMCELNGEELGFQDIAERYRRGINGQDNRISYVKISERDWNIHRGKHKKDNLISKVGFSVDETEEGKFELALSEDVYLKGYDEYCMNFPVLRREGKARYHVVWNNLITEYDEEFYAVGETTNEKKPANSFLNGFLGMFITRPTTPRNLNKILFNHQSNTPQLQNASFPDLPTESFLMSYDGVHRDYFQELITKSNERFSGTRAEFPRGTSGEVKNMYAIKRMALVSTIANNPSLQSQGFYPITPMQSESLLKAGKLPDPSKYWEDLALLLYDTNGKNPKEAQALKESIIQHRTDLDLSQSDLEKRLVVVSAGGEPDQNMSCGVKPIVVPGITLVYPHEILDKTGQNHKFEYGLDEGLPSVSEIGNGSRTLYTPDETEDIGLRVLCRYWVLGLVARDWYLTSSSEVGRVNFAPQGHAP